MKNLPKQVVTGNEEVCTTTRGDGGGSLIGSERSGGMILFLGTYSIYFITLHEALGYLFFLLRQNLMIALHFKKDHLKQGKRIDTSKNLSDIILAGSYGFDYSRW